MKTKTDLYTKIVLTVIAIFLGAIVVKDINIVSKAQAGEVINLSGQGNAIHQERITKDFEDYYAVNDTYVFYNGVEIEGASGRRFELLKDGYTKDNNYVYYKGKKVTSANKQFEVLSGGYARNGIAIFYKGREIKKTNMKIVILSNN